MPLLREEAEKLSENQVEQGIIETIVYRDELFSRLPFKKIDGKAYVYNREAEIATADFVSPNGEIREGGSTFSEHVAKLRILAGDVDTDKFLLETMSDRENQLALQIRQKVKGLGIKFRQALVHQVRRNELGGFGDLGEGAATAFGDDHQAHALSQDPSASRTNLHSTIGHVLDPNQATVGDYNKAFDALDTLMSNDEGMLIAGGGHPISLTALDELIDTTAVLGESVIMMHPIHRRQYLQLLRTQNVSVTEIMDRDLGKALITHNGTVIIVNEFIPVFTKSFTVNGETVWKKVAPIYSLYLSEENGVTGLYGGQSAGIRIENLGTVMNKDSVRTRIKWYVSTACKHTKAIGKLADVYMGDAPAGTSAASVSQHLLK